VTIPRFSVAEYCTPRLTFAQDLALYSELGIEGIGIDTALKLRELTADVELFKASGLTATFCFAPLSTILPLQDVEGLPSASGDREPAARVEAICAGVRALEPFQPVCCVCSTGPVGSYEEAEAREIAVNGLRKVARAAADVGTMLAVEPHHVSLKDEFTWVNSISDGVELLDAIGEPNTGLILDVWHLWDSPDFFDGIRLHHSRIVGIHLNDWREPTRSWCDRVLPGDGAADLRGMLRALDDSGFDGWYELEVVSDDGSFGNDFPDSLWKLDPGELISAARDNFAHAWHTRAEPT